MCVLLVRASWARARVGPRRRGRRRRRRNKEKEGRGGCIQAGKQAMTTGKGLRRAAPAAGGPVCRCCVCWNGLDSVACLSLRRLRLLWRVMREQVHLASPAPQHHHVHNTKHAHTHRHHTSCYHRRACRRAGEVLCGWLALTIRQLLLTPCFASSLRPHPLPTTIHPYTDRPRTHKQARASSWTSWTCHWRT